MKRCEVFGNAEVAGRGAATQIWKYPDLTKAPTSSCVQCSSEAEFHVTTVRLHLPTHPSLHPSKVFTPAAHQSGLPSSPRCPRPFHRTPAPPHPAEHIGPLPVLDLTSIRIPLDACSIAH